MCGIYAFMLQTHIMYQGKNRWTSDIQQYLKYFSMYVQEINLWICIFVAPIILLNYTSHGITIGSCKHGD